MSDKNIDKDIERVKELQSTIYEGGDYIYLNKNDKQALENVLSELNKYQEAYKIFVNLNSNLKSELETWKKIAEKLAEELSKHIWLNDKDAILKIYREKVEKDE